MLFRKRDTNGRKVSRILMSIILVCLTYVLQPLLSDLLSMAITDASLSYEVCWLLSIQNRMEMRLDIKEMIAYIAKLEFPTMKKTVKFFIIPKVNDCFGGHLPSTSICPE